MTLPDTHSIVTYVAALVLGIYVFVYPADQSALPYIASAFLMLNGGQALGDLGVGGKRKLQGGATAPDVINPPVPAGESNVPITK